MIEFTVWGTCLPLRGTYALQIGYVFCSWLKFLSEIRFTYWDREGEYV